MPIYHYFKPCYAFKDDMSIVLQCVVLHESSPESSAQSTVPLMDFNAHVEIIEHSFLQNKPRAILFVLKFLSLVF